MLISAPPYSWWAFVRSLWHRSHSPVLLSKRPGQFLFTLFSFTSITSHPRFQEHMSLRSTLLIRRLFCLWIFPFSAHVVDCIVTGVSVGVLPSRQKVFIGLLMSLLRVVPSANLHLSFNAQSEQSQILVIGPSYRFNTECLNASACVLSRDVSRSFMKRTKHFI